MRTILFASALSVLALTSAFSASATETAPSPAIAAACQQALGLNPADTDFAACTSSLSDAVARHQASVSPQFAREQKACAMIGAGPGTPTFASCVSNLDAALVEPSLMAN